MNAGRACVTGPTAGIGRAFAEELAARGFDLVLVARDSVRLHGLADEMGRAYGIGVEVIVADLATDDGCRSVMSRLAHAGHPVDVLVNNAGFGVHQPFVGGDLAREEALMDVLCRAVLRLTHAVLPGMLDRGRGQVINVSSVAGWVPASTYSAAKAWTTTFTESLAVQLHGSGVSATAVCPGYTRSEFHERAGVEMSALPSWAWLDARDVSSEGLDAALRGATVSVPSMRYKLLALAVRATPRPLLRQVLSALSLPGRGGQRWAGAGAAAAKPHPLTPVPMTPVPMAPVPMTPVPMTPESR